jgi:hypothetical protein
MQVRPPLRFTDQDAREAGDAWGLNCGPAAVCAIVGLTPEEIRPHLGDFELKRYTNPTLMWEILLNLNVHIKGIRGLASNVSQLPWPRWGLARVQWEGPWTKPGVPMRVRYRQTHWVGVNSSNPDNIGIWDVNCLSNGTGWVSLDEWTNSLVPWLLKQCHPKADGKWHLTHTVEIGLPDAG